MISRNGARHYQWGTGCDGWHLVKRDELSVIQEQMSPSTSEARHYHTKARQFFFVLSGTAVFEIAGKREVLRRHEGAEIAPGVPHQIANASEDNLEFIVISHPASHGDGFSSTTDGSRN
jgi:mannose-6-phosphate isomerase-like protein (cupin superfamily)